MIQKAKLLVVVLLLPKSLLAQEPKSDVIGSTDLLNVMRERAAGIEVRAGGSDLQPLQPTPLFRYSDPVRGILDAALWGYGGEGRPDALLKTEIYNKSQGTTWVHCLASLSEELIRADWQDGVTYQAKLPGLTMRELTNGPPPHALPAGRAAQMKLLNRRFAVTIANGNDNLERMRLMPRPLSRYADPEHGIRDGAIFGYTMGTNPDAVLVIELAERDGGEPTWMYGIGPMTSAGVHVDLDGAAVFDVPFDPTDAGLPRAHERWVWRRIEDPDLLNSIRQRD